MWRSMGFTVRVHRELSIKVIKGLDGVYSTG